MSHYIWQIAGNCSRRIKVCTPALLWAALLIATIILGSCLTLHYTLTGDILDEAQELEKRQATFMYFGTFTRSFVTMFEVTFGNWAPISRLLTDVGGEGYAWFFLMYRSLIGFGVVMIVSSVFIKETFRAAESDDEVMIMQKNRQAIAHTKRMEMFFAEADQSNDGYVSLDEFKTILNDERVQHWLSAQELQLKDADLVFQLLDTGGGDARLSAEELVTGLSRLRGGARSMDMISMSYTIRHMNKRLDEVYKHVCPTDQLNMGQSLSVNLDDL